MKRWEQLRALEGILGSLGIVRQELDDAVSSAHKMRNEAGEGSPFAKDYLDKELCVAIENLCDDVGTATKTVEGMLDELDEEEVE